MALIKRLEAGARDSSAAEAVSRAISRLGAARVASTIALAGEGIDYNGHVFVEAAGVMVSPDDLAALRDKHPDFAQAMRTRLRAKRRDARSPEPWHSAWYAGAAEDGGNDKLLAGMPARAFARGQRSTRHVPISRASGWQQTPSSAGATHYKRVLPDGTVYGIHPEFSESWNPDGTKIELSLIGYTPTRVRASRGHQLEGLGGDPAAVTTQRPFSHYPTFRDALAEGLGAHLFSDQDVTGFTPGQVVMFTPDASKPWPQPPATVVEFICGSGFTGGTRAETQCTVRTEDGTRWEVLAGQLKAR